MEVQRSILKGIRLGLIVLGVAEVAILATVGNNRADLIRTIRRLERLLPMDEKPDLYRDTPPFPMPEHVPSTLAPDPVSLLFPSTPLTV